MSTDRPTIPLPARYRGIPGPYAVEHQTDRRDDWHLVTADLRGETVSLVDTMNRDYRIGPEESEAHVRLFAAAPDLLAIVVKLEAYWASGNFSRKPELWDEMKAAIAKALPGETP